MGDRTLTRFNALWVSPGDLVEYQGRIATVTGVGDQGEHGLNKKLDGRPEWVSYTELKVVRQDGCNHTTPCASRAVCNDINYVWPAPDQE